MMNLKLKLNKKNHCSNEVNFFSLLFYVNNNNNNNN